MSVSSSSRILKPALSTVTSRAGIARSAIPQMLDRRTEEVISGFIHLALCITCAYVFCMDYQWDPAKAASNLDKHGVDFADAVGVFEDTCALTVREEDVSGEQRVVTLGSDFLGRIILHDLPLFPHSRRQTLSGAAPTGAAPFSWR